MFYLPILVHYNITDFIQYISVYNAYYYIPPSSHNMFRPYMVINKCLHFAKNFALHLSPNFRITYECDTSYFQYKLVKNSRVLLGVVVYSSKRYCLMSPYLVTCFFYMQPRLPRVFHAPCCLCMSGLLPTHSSNPVCHAGFTTHAAGLRVAPYPNLHLTAFATRGSLSLLLSCRFPSLLVHPEMEAVFSFETSTKFFRITQRHAPEVTGLHGHFKSNEKSLMETFIICTISSIIKIPQFPQSVSVYFM
jgi:hypothetical protein